jgi:hypothetical protein
LAALGEGGGGLGAWCLYPMGWWCASVMRIRRRVRRGAWLGRELRAGGGWDLRVWTRCALRVTGAHRVMVKGLRIRGLGRFQSPAVLRRERQIAPVPVSVPFRPRPGFGFSCHESRAIWLRGIRIST